jgi:hypothetical protein
LTLTVQELIALIEAILDLIRNRRLLPPASATHVKAVLERTNLMSTATVTWVNPTFRVAVPPLPPVALDPSEIASVDIFDSFAPDTPIGTVSGGTTMTFTTPELAVGDHAFTVVVIETKKGLKSAPSDASAILTVGTPDLTAPMPATNVVAVLNP